MDKLRFTINIEAPAQKVWDTMLNDSTYREWTDAFGPGCYYVGDWRQGSKILFLAPEKETGQLSGMVSRIRENRPFEFISIEHLGFVKDGKEDLSSDEVKKWSGATENYTLTKKGGTTEVVVEMNSPGDYSEMFQDMWPKALQKLKTLAQG